MEKVRIEDVETYMGPAAEKRPLGTALGTTDVAMNYYELEPGESFAFGYHRHGDQEEVFYVQSGVVTFETEDGPVEVGAGEAIRFAPGEFQRGVNEVAEPRSNGPEDERNESSGGDERVVALALGAPRETEDLEMLRECPDCNKMAENTVEMADDREALVTVCADCGAVTGRFD